MWKQHESVASLLARPEIEQTRFPGPESDGHLTIERDVWRRELDLRRVVAVAFEEFLTPRHLLGKHLRQDAGGLLMRDEGRARGLERQVSKIVVAMEVAVDHPFDRLVRDFADEPEQLFALTRMLAGVDQQHALFGDEKDRVGAAVVEEEIEIGRDLLYCRLLRSPGFLRHRGRHKEIQTGENS